MTDRTIIDQRIAELRKQKGLTQAELAELLGVTHQAVSQWERSETLPDILTLPRIAEIFGENINAILGLEETKSVSEESPAPEAQETEEQPEPESAEAAFPDEEDEKSIKYELNLNIRKLFTQTLIMGIVAAISIILTVVTRVLPAAIISAVPVAPAAYAVFNFLLMGLTIFINRVGILNGLNPLLRFKGNSDTAVAVAAVTGALQTIISSWSVFFGSTAVIFQNSRLWNFPGSSGQ